MDNKNYSFSFNSSKTANEIFETLLDIRQWWVGFYGEDIKGDSNKLNDEFTFLAGGGMHYTKHRLIELIPNKKIVWEVIDSNLSFVDQTDEWTGTKIDFEINKVGEKNQVTFTHVGLVPKFACYQNCSSAWTQYLQKLAEKLQ